MNKNGCEGLEPSFRGVKKKVKKSGHKWPSYTTEVLLVPYKNMQKNSDILHFNFWLPVDWTTSVPLQLHE